MIEIALDQYSDIFNEWDPAPFKRREIDADLELYLEGSAEEIPSKYPIELYFIIPAGSRNQLMEQESRSALKSFFTFRIYFLKRDLRKVNIRILRYLVTGFILLWVGTIYPGHTSDAPWATVITEGIFIGGWVFLWEAVSLFFFSNRDLYQRRKMYKRLLDSPIFFREASDL